MRLGIDWFRLFENGFRCGDAVELFAASPVLITLFEPSSEEA